MAFSATSSSRSHQARTTGIIVPPTTTTITNNSSTSFVVPVPPSVISRPTLHRLIKNVDPNVLLDDDVEELLLTYTDQFMGEIMEGAAKLAVHRKGKSVETQDLERCLERNHNIFITSEEKGEPKPAKKSVQTDAHKQRVALMRKALKKN